MKSLMVCALLFSSAAFACPDITGSYTCKFNSAISMKEIVKTDGGFAVNSDGYEIEYHVDGKTYELPSTENYTDAKVRTTCNESEMIVDFNASILYEGSIIAKQVSKSTYSMEGSNLVINQKIKMKGLPMPAVKWNCTRN